MCYANGGGKYSTDLFFYPRYKVKLVLKAYLFFVGLTILLSVHELSPRPTRLNFRNRRSTIVTFFSISQVNVTVFL